jgi:hypothetical protein
MPETTTAPVMPSASSPATAGPSPFEELINLPGMKDEPEAPRDEKFHVEQKDNPARPARPAPTDRTKPTDKHKSEVKSATEPAKPIEEDPEFATGPAALRNAYTRTKAELKELKAKYESREKSPSEPPPEFTERLTAAEKRAHDLDTEIKYLRYEKSTEYRDKYVKPMEKAFHRAFSEVSQLPITDEEGNDRLGTRADFEAIVRAPLGEAKRMAKAFGDSAQDVMDHRKKILELREEAGQAIDDYRAKGQEYEKQRQDESDVSQQKQAKLFQEHLATGAKERPEWFGPPDETDPHDGEMLNWGKGRANLLFGDTSQLTDDQRIALHASAHNMISTFPRIAYRLKKVTKERDALKERLAEFEASEPGPGGTRIPRPAKSNTNWSPSDAFDELDRLDKEGPKPLR